MSLNKSNAVTLFLVCVASILAIYTVLTTQVTYLSANDWGILSRLPVTYWMGIAAICALVLFSFRSSKSLNLNVSIAIFVLVLVYTNFIPQIIETPIGLTSMSLWPSSQASLTISTGHIAVGQPNQMLDYNNWPFFTIFTSIFMLITGSPLSWLLKWFPLFSITFWALIVFLILKRFLGSKYGLIGAALFLCGSWTKQQYFGPQSFAFMLFLLVLYLSLKSESGTFNFNKKSFFILALAVFIGLVFFHVLTPVALLLMLAATYLITSLFAMHAGKQSKTLGYFVLLCTTIVVAYNVYVTPSFVSYGFNKVVDAFGTSLFQQVSRIAGSQYQTFTSAIIYGLVFGFVGISLIGLLLMLRDKNQPKLQTLTYLSSIGVMLILALVPYGEEGPFRAFMFTLPFLSLICVWFLKRKPALLGTLLCIFLLLSVPAIYGADSYCLITDPELAGGKYVAQYLPDTSHVFGKVETYVRYFDPSSSLIFYTIGSQPFLDYDSLDIEQHIDGINYLTISRNQINYVEYYSGINPYQNMNLLQNINVTRACLYDNGNFSVHILNPYISSLPPGW
jgi:hypothetical protein